MTGTTERPRRLKESIGGRPILFHPTLKRQLEVWAHSCGWNPAVLQAGSETVIKTRWHDARFYGSLFDPDLGLPDVFTLKLGNVDVFFSPEPHAIVIRGYGWDPVEHGLNPEDTGGFYCDAVLPPAREAPGDK